MRNLANSPLNLERLSTGAGTSATLVAWYPAVPTCGVGQFPARTGHFLGQIYEKWPGNLRPDTRP